MLQQLCYILLKPFWCTKRFITLILSFSNIELFLLKCTNKFIDICFQFKSKSFNLHSNCRKCSAFWPYNRKLLEHCIVSRKGDVWHEHRMNIKESTSNLPILFSPREYSSTYYTGQVKVLNRI